MRLAFQRRPTRQRRVIFEEMQVVLEWGAPKGTWFSKWGKGSSRHGLRGTRSLRFQLQRALKRLRSGGRRQWPHFHVSGGGRLCQACKWLGRLHKSRLGFRLGVVLIKCSFWRERCCWGSLHRRDLSLHSFRFNNSSRHFL